MATEVDTELIPIRDRVKDLVNRSLNYSLYYLDFKNRLYDCLDLKKWRNRSSSLLKLYLYHALLLQKNTVKLKKSY